MRERNKRIEIHFNILTLDFKFEFFFFYANKKFFSPVAGRLLLTLLKQRGEFQSKLFRPELRFQY